MNLSDSHRVRSEELSEYARGYEEIAEALAMGDLTPVEVCNALLAQRLLGGDGNKEPSVAGRRHPKDSS